MTSVKPPACETADPLAQAREIRVTLRSDIKASRQVYQGEPVYVIHDPVSFRSHRLTVFQYRILASLNADNSLGENFQSLVARQEFTAEDEKVFLDLVSSFSKLGLVIMPGASGAKLYEQHKKIKSMKRRGKLLGMLFVQIPLVNPDKFLNRTVHRVSWMFSKAFLVVWLLGMAAAGMVVYSRFSDIVQPLNGILATKNLAFLWVAFVLLKVWHELGHAYACKVFGGFVPEMGTVLIAGTPAAFVDASSAWSFPERHKRLVVMCGGMFFESLVFIPCVFVWAFSSSPFLQSCSYQLLVMASVVTFFFNANPLMKFDGYFILSELVGIQNLRPRADAHIKGILATNLVGVARKKSTDSLKTRALLVGYGVSAMIYKTFLVISIAMVVAIKFPLVGLALAAFHVGTTVGMGVHKMAKYLLKDKETEPVRGRARLVAAVVLIGGPIAAMIVPVPFGVVTQGLVGAEVEHFVNVESPGSLERTLVESGQVVMSSDPLVELSNERLREDLKVAKASLDEAKQRWKILQQMNLTESSRQFATVTELQQQVAELQRRVDRLSMNSPGSGTVVRLPARTDRGQFMREGNALAVVVDGRPVLRTWINEDQLGSISKSAGSEVTFLIPGRSTKSHKARITKIEPAAEAVFDNMALTYVTGGEILVDPATGKPLEPVFQIDLTPVDDVLALTEHGARVHLKLPRRYESIASWAARKCMRFVQELLVA